MSLQILPVVFFLVALACVPFLIRWLKARLPSPSRMGGTQSRFVSAVAVGPNQRVVTVEVGPLHDRVWLTLGVGAAGIQCLHTASAPLDAQDRLTIPAASGGGVLK